MEKSIKATAEASLEIALKALKDFDLDMEQNESRKKPDWGKFFKGLAKVMEGIGEIIDAFKG